MTHTRTAGLAMLCIFGGLATTASGAHAASSAGAGLPTIRSVTPLTANVGDRLTIRGRNLASRGARRTTVVFKRGATSIVVKVQRATRTTIKLVIPRSLARYVVRQNGIAQPTRFRLKVRARRTAKRFTAIARSPRIGLPGSLPGSATDSLFDLWPVLPGLDPADDCNGDGILDAADDLVTETPDGAVSVCAADNNTA